MKVSLILASVMLMLASPSEELSTGKTNNNITGENSIQLVFVTTVEGKAFFADNTTPRNWIQASDYCRSMNMRLASITSEAQFAALNNAPFTDGYRWGHWTSGRDTQEVTQFRWNETNTRPSDINVPFKKWTNIDFQTCVLFMKWTGTSSFLSYSPCWHTSVNTLCETLPV